MIRFASIDVDPFFGAGFIVRWTLGKESEFQLPLRFQVFCSEAQDEAYKPISPEIEDAYSYAEQDEAQRFLPKDVTLYFRVQATDAAGQVVMSDPVSLFQRLSREEYLIARRMIGIEALSLRRRSGVPCDIWQKSVLAPACPTCADPILGSPASASCPACLGTGTYPPFYGPSPSLVEFSPRDKSVKLDTGVVLSDGLFDVRGVAAQVARNDILAQGGRLYRAIKVTNAVEIRRVPVVVKIVATEISASDPAQVLLKRGTYAGIWSLAQMKEHA